VCSGGSALSCKLNVQRGRPIAIVVAVRVRPNATAGSQVVYQALAQDDLSNTAASDQVVVAIAPAPIAPTTSPDPAPRPTRAPDTPAHGANAPAQSTVSASRTSRPTPSLILANPETPALPVQTAVMLPIVPVAILRSSAGTAGITVPADSNTPADSWLASAPGVPTPAHMIEPSAPDPVVSEQAAQTAPADMPAPAPVEQRQIVQLPNTAATPQSAGVAAVLLGLASIIHGILRVRRATAQLERQGVAMSRLVALAGAHARRRARMREQTTDLREEQELCP
jgi:hypothetical protein